MRTSKAKLNAFCIVILLQTYGDQVVKCGGFNVIGSHKLIQKGTIRKYGFVGIGMTSLEEVCNSGGRL